MDMNDGPLLQITSSLVWIRYSACVDKLSICVRYKIPARADVSVACVDPTLACPDEYLPCANNNYSCADINSDNLETYRFFYPDIIKKLCINSIYSDFSTALFIYSVKPISFFTTSAMRFT